LKNLALIFAMIIALTAALDAAQYRAIMEYYDSLHIKELRLVTVDSIGNILQDEGWFVRWYKDGTRWMEGNHKNGLPHGKVFEFRPNLPKKAEQEFETGRKIGEVQFDSLGLMKIGIPDSLKKTIRVETATLPNGKLVKKWGYDRTKSIFVNHGPATVWY